MGRQALRSNARHERTPPPATLFPLEEAVRSIPRAAGTGWALYFGNALEAYDAWPVPATIVSDGAYGVGGFHGDPRTPEGLPEWYRPHVAAWSRRAAPATTLWFWNTEIGWATVHPVLVAHGWEYVQTIVWDKSIPHIAGNVNGDTIRGRAWRMW
jgi:hypothetical protein